MGVRPSDLRLVALGGEADSVERIGDGAQATASAGCVVVGVSVVGVVIVVLFPGGPGPGINIHGCQLKQCSSSLFFSLCVFLSL